MFIDYVEGQVCVDVLLVDLCVLFNVMLCCQIMVMGFYDYGYLLVCEVIVDYDLNVGLLCQCLWCICVGYVVVVIGVLEWLLSFVGNDVLGVILVFVVCDFIVDYGVVFGCRVVVVINNDDVYCMVLVVLDVGLLVFVVIDV